jgi:hypothetical protein
MQKALLSQSRTFLGSNSFADIPYAANNKFSTSKLQRTKTDFNRELAPITALANQVQAYSHRSRLGFLPVVMLVAAVRLAESLWHEHLDRLSYQFLSPVIEQHGSLFIGQENPAFHIGNENCIWHRT